MAAGILLEPVNLLQPKRKNTFAGDGEKVEFQLDGQSLDNAEAKVYVDGELKTPKSTIPLIYRREL